MRKKFIKTLLVIVLITLFIGIFGACNSLDTQFKFELGEDGYVITKYIGNGGEVNIPEKYRGVLVTAIGEGAFSDSAITEITIPKTIKKVGFAAFRNCNELQVITTATLQGYTEESKTGKFSYWFGDHETEGQINFQKPMTINMTEGGYLYSKVFYGVGPIKEFNFPENYSPESIPDRAFMGTLLEKINWKSSIKYIGDYAFAGTCMEKVDLSGVKIIPLGAFYNSRTHEYDLTGVKEIGSAAFAMNYELTSIVIPSSVKKLHSEAFATCVNLSSVVFESPIKEIPKNTFADCESLKTFEFYEGLETIEKDAFESVRFEEVRLPSTIKRISAGAITTKKLYVENPNGWMRSEGGVHTSIDASIMSNPEEAAMTIGYHNGLYVTYYYRKD